MKKPLGLELQDEPSARIVLEAAAATLGIAIEVEAEETWPLDSSRFCATARIQAANETFLGYGVGAAEQAARCQAAMECLERQVQFGCSQPSAVTASAVSLGGDALAVEDCGLYCGAQYAAAEFPFAPFSPQAPLEWLPVHNLLTGERRLVPLEFIYPRAPISRKPLVAETSSGTAAHLDERAAWVAALCEVIERDSVMLFWFRQPETASIPIEDLPAPEIRDELRAVQEMGFVVVVCRLASELRIPCFLIFALKHESLAYGVGCHPDWHRAMAHAVSELGRSLRWLCRIPWHEVEFRPLWEVRIPEDHYALYNRGAFHDVLRQVLAQVVRPAPPEELLSADRSEVPDEEAFAQLLAVLAEHGYQAWGYNLAPDCLADFGISVVRVLVPGLIPLQFGHDRIRFGCRRLWSREGPGRFCTLLPHFMM